jgi:hypothetical protein
VERLVDPNEVNELDRAAKAVQAESSWSSYLSPLSGAALAAASAMWFFLRAAFIFARRAANLRMHVSNPKRATALGLEAPYFPRFCSLIPRFSVKLSVLSAIKACPPHDDVRRGWRIDVASAVSLIESSQKIGRSHKGGDRR